MKLLMLILFFPFSFEGENGRELLDTALEKCSRLESLEACRDILYRYGVADKAPSVMSPERQVQDKQPVWRQDSSHNGKT